MTIAVATIRLLGKNVRFETGVPVEFPYAHSKDPAPRSPAGDPYQQKLEPAGYYVTPQWQESEHYPASYELGVMRFENPLVLEFNDPPYRGHVTYDATSWKARLAKHLKAKGKKLSEKIRAAGFDGVVAVQSPHDVREIVDLGAHYIPNAMDPTAPTRVPARPLKATKLMEDYVSQYVSGGSVIASSRTKRSETPDIPAGSWKVDEFKGAYGHEVEELVELNPLDLEPQEFKWDNLEKSMYPGRYDDALRYAEWIEEGHTPPPINVVETDAGTLRIVDGHRRAAAAFLAGVPVKAWVSWLTPHPEGLRDSRGRDMEVGLTYELARGEQYRPNRRIRIDREEITDVANKLAASIREEIRGSDHREPLQEHYDAFGLDSEEILNSGVKVMVEAKESRSHSLVTSGSFSVSWLLPDSPGWITLTLNGSLPIREFLRTGGVLEYELRNILAHEVTHSQDPTARAASISRRPYEKTGYFDHPSEVKAYGAMLIEEVLRTFEGPLANEHREVFEQQARAKGVDFGKYLFELAVSTSQAWSKWIRKMSPKSQQRILRDAYQTLADEGLI